jgi:L-fuconolactonase
VVIDSHFHTWQHGKNGAIWPTPEWERIYRDFDLDEYEQTARDSGVTGAVLVQASPTDEDTDYICHAAEQSDFVKAVIGYVDFDSALAVARIRELGRHPKIRGVRPMKFMAEDDWLIGQRYTPVFDAVATEGLIFEALVMTGHLPFLAQLAASRTELPIILNHAAMPDIGAEHFAAWQEGIAQVAQSRNVTCKLSGLWDKDIHSTGDDEIAPYVRHVIACFGAERVIWGSDWPVLRMHGDYRLWMAQCERLTQALGAAAQAAIFHANAARLYRIG